MLTINMRSSANTVKSQGVGSCYDEQVELVKHGLKDFHVSENGRGRFDIVHYHTVNLLYFIERWFNKKDTVGIGYVHFLPETLDESLKLPMPFRKIFYKYLLMFYNSMDYLVTVNPYFIPKIREQGVSHPTVACIPNYVSSECFYPMDCAKVAAAKKRYGIPGNRFVVLGAGQLQTRKGIFEFVETAKLLPQVQFAWAGGFSFGRISSGYNEIKEMMRSLPENVAFLGIVPREDMPEIYNMADLLFLPSYDELFPMTVLEALCCKKPVLLRDIPLYEHILSGGYLCGNSPQGFADAIESIAGDPSEYAHWVEKAWAYHQRYTGEATLRQWEQLYGTAYAAFRSEKKACKEEGRYDEYAGTH